MKYLILSLLFINSAFATFTAFDPLPLASGTLTVKGSLLTSNGTVQIPYAPCANGEIIAWDDNEASGFKCVTSAGSAYTVVHTPDLTAYQYVEGSGLGATTAMSGLTTSFTTNATSAPVEITLDGNIQVSLYNVGGEQDMHTNCTMRVYRGATIIATQVCYHKGRSNSAGYMEYACNIGTMTDVGASASTTYSYTFEIVNYGTYQSSSCTVATGTGENFHTTIKQLN